MELHNTFTCAQIRYLICLWQLSEGRCGVKNAEIARTLELSRPSVHNMLQSLIELGAVSHEAFGLVYLTEKGYSSARCYATSYDVLECELTPLYEGYAVGENAILALLADLPTDRLRALCRAYGHFL